nr:serine/threonine-protein kinase AFC3 isoform X1 [Ipomoea batatas]
MVAIGPENTAAEEMEQTRKRRRLTWDVAPLSSENQAAEAEEKDKKIQKVEPPSRLRYLSPPHRDDDRDGHYVFSLGENLTPRYKILSKMGEG